MAFGITRCDAGPRMSRVQVATGSCLFDVRAASHTAQVALGKEDSSQGHHRAHHPLPGQLGKRRRFVAMGDEASVLTRAQVQGDVLVNVPSHVKRPCWK